MTDTLRASMFVAGSGMRAQGTRLRVISENVANADSTAKVEGGDPYRRKTISFKDQLDRSLNVDLVKVREIARAPTRSHSARLASASSPVHDALASSEVSSTR